MLTIQSEDLRLSLHEPGDGAYLGTRFDRSGIFDSLELCGVQMCGRWFERYDPMMHDAVCGPAEEFAPVGFSDARPGDTFFKPGVGLLTRPDDAPYDRFRLYDVADGGSWSAGADERSVMFSHRIAGLYEYGKGIVLTGPRSFEIRHSLYSECGLSTCVYNHNFFTFGNLSVGPRRTADFPFRPEGSWRARYDCVAFTASGLRFSRSMQKGESVYSGDIHACGETGMPYALTLGEAPYSVHIQGDVPVTHTVFWSNHRIACLEPYNDVTAAPGQTFRWSIKYTFRTDEN